jgi:hypothetical protein
MELWTDYEGRTIDGAYPLVKLLEPEGRSAFFSTTNGTGKPTVIRLIESHFDDEEILARWREVTALDHANLIKLKNFGQVELDGTSLVYAVMEPAEANLGEILRERRLTVLETRQVAESLVAALEALHARGFVHEHVEPGNVMAVGETIKLRSDCVREAAEGDEGRAMIRRDVHGLAGVILRALTQQRTMEAASRDLPLEAPFDQIVRRGLSGEWGLAQISAALAPVAAAKPVARPVVKEMPVERPIVASAPVANPVMKQASGPVVTPIRPSVSPVDRVVVPERESEQFDLRKIAYGIGTLLLLLLVGWFFVHGCSSSSKSVSKVAPAVAVPSQDASGVPAATVAPTKPSAAMRANDRSVGAGGGSGLWRVVAYTYNRQDQAQHKAETIAQSHPDLKPEVFTPNGRAPYLVTLGGGMSREDAFALSGKAKREGMPRDIYAQNYRGR